MIRLAIAFNLILLASVATASEPIPFQVEYDVSKNDMFLGVSIRTLARQKNGLWKMSAQTQPEGLVALFFDEKVTETSLIRAKDNHIQPLSYSYKKQGGDEPESFSIGFDWQNKRLQHSVITETTSLANDNQDLLSFQLAMMQQLQNGQDEMQFTIAAKKRIERYHLRNIGTETLDTEIGTLHTTKLEYFDQQRNQRYTFWCARELNYIPYMSQKIESDGDVILLQMRRYNQRPASIVEIDYDDL